MVDVSKPYNQGVSPQTLNRILLFLGFIGIFISGVLSLEHLRQIEIPCTAGGGCATVARDPSSYVLGIPVAYIGFFGYVLLTALAITRSATSQLLSKTLVGFGYMGSAIGVIASLYLQYISFFKIGATCIWCLSSAITMIITFVLYTILFGKVGDTEATVSKFNPKELILGIVGTSIGVAAALGVTMNAATYRGPIVVVDDSVAQHLIPEPASERNQMGPDDAPVTIVEFADLCCPTCRASFPKIHELVQKYPGKLRVIYRHFPLFRLKGHEMASTVAITAEVAATKGKFWDFATAFTAPEEAPTTRQGVDMIAKSAGLTPEEITNAIENDDSVANKRATRDYTDAVSYLKIEGTPTYFLMAKGQPTKKVTLTGIIGLFEEKGYKELLKP